jgi:hypothetical protein
MATGTPQDSGRLAEQDHRDDFGAQSAGTAAGKLVAKRLFKRDRTGGARARLPGRATP